MIESHGDFGSYYQFSKAVHGSGNTTIITADSPLDYVRVFKIQGHVNKIDGSNPVADITDSDGNVIYQIPRTVGWFAVDWDYPGARTDGTTAFAKGNIKLNVVSDVADFFIKVEAFPVMVPAKG